MGQKTAQVWTPRFSFATQGRSKSTVKLTRKVEDSLDGKEGKLMQNMKGGR